MKKSVLLVVFIVSCMTSFGQTKEKDLTQAELFSSQAGTLIERQFVEIGKVKGVEVKVIKYKDLNNGTSKSALRFEYEYKSSYSSDSKIASLDLDEIDGLIKSMKNLQSTVFPSTRDIYTEVTFKSRTGFEAGAYFSTDKGKWTAYIQIEKFDSNSLVFLTIEDFSTILGLIEQAKAKM